MAKYLILACDGGGVRGYITSSVLQKLLADPRVGNFLSQVSLMAGTSTGGFITLGLAGGLDIAIIQAMYRQAMMKQAFRPNPYIGIGHGDSARLRDDLDSGRIAGAPEHPWWRDLLGRLFRDVEEVIFPVYTDTGIQELARQALGTKRLADLSPVLVTTLVLDDKSVQPSKWMPRVLSNLPGSTVAQMAAWEAGMCSCAAPVYLPPYRPESAALGYCADGALFATNPSMFAISSALTQGVALDDIYVLSLDAGTFSNAMPESVIEHDWYGPLSTGLLAWMYPRPLGTGVSSTPKFPLVMAIFDTTAASVTLHAQALLRARYLRVHVPLLERVILDDTSDRAYTTMETSLARFYSSSAYAAVTAWLETNFSTSSDPPPPVSSGGCHARGQRG